MTEKQTVFTKSAVIGMFSSVLIAFALSYYLYATRLDVEIHDVVIAWSEKNGLEDLWGYLSRIGQDWFQILVCIFFGVFYYMKCNYRMSRLWYGSIVVYLLSGILVQVIKFTVGRPRPKMWPEYDPIWFDMAARFHSWPSGHTITTFAWLACILPCYPRKTQLFLALAAVVVSFSRVGVGAHYMSDVLSGAVLGYVFGVLLRAKFNLGKKS